MIHLTTEDILIIHREVLNPGLPGARGNPSDIVARIESTIHYENLTTFPTIAALYAETIAKGHIFNDGNKRTALACTASFLQFNNKMLAANIEIADQMVKLANTPYNRKEFSLWLESRIH